MATDLREQLQGTLGAAYVLERELGGGGMSRVFLAEDRSLERLIVVKVLLPELAAGMSVDRFRREILLAAKLQHPHIVPVHAAGESHGLPYFTMPYVDGESLRGRIARDGELPVSDALRILRDVASALNYAHSRGVVHRDIKPDNVLLSSGVAVVTDFGVAKALTVSASTTHAGSSSSSSTSTGLALGTPTYMAPEQATADPSMDHRVDIYAFGIMAYEMLTGQPPFTNRSPQAVLAAHVTEEPEPVERRRPSVPPQLCALIARCLEKHPADRPQSAGEIMQALDAMATPSGGMSPTGTVRVARRGTPAPGTLPAHRTARYVLLSALIIVVTAMFLLRARSPSILHGLFPGKDDGPTSAVALVQDSVEDRPARDSAASTTSERPDSARSAAGTDRAAVRAPRVNTTEVPPRRAHRPTVAATDSAPAAAPDSQPVTAERAGTGAVPSSRSPTPDSATSTSVAPRSVAGESLRTAPPVVAPSPAPARDARQDISALVASYAAAIEKRDIAAIRRVYPGLTPSQQQDWSRFFETVQGVEVTLHIAKLDVADSAAEAQLTGEYIYDNMSTRRSVRQAVTFHATMRRSAGLWKMVTIR
ncbi:MAG TPA: serine/threonine-protein kinase [Gemmatimonadaceae bacterium]|nr:serine/threonine-protein kinase [Gemmatimonadaceae bacterium]